MNREKTINLINRYLAGEASEQEQARLETWYLLMAETAPDDDTDHDFSIKGKDIWKRISQDMGTQLPAAKQVRLNSRAGYFKYAIAAAVLISFGIAILSYFYSHQGADRFTVEASKDIAPGGNSAYLTLSNGKKINLNQTGNGVIIAEAGFEIVKLKDGQLIYKATGTQTNDTQINTIETPTGGQYMVVLPDGSKVWLNSESSLVYPARFSSSSRIVSLKGEGYFEIAHIRDQTTGKLLPFIVNTKHGQQNQELQVLGTHFNINSYDNEPALTTTLVEGKVAIRAAGKSLELKPGQQSKLDGSAISISEADTDIAIAWKNGEFVFHEDLESAMRKVARWYGVEVVYKSSAPKSLLLGGWMSREKNISDVLDHIQSTKKVHFTIEGRRVIVTD